MNIEKDLEQEYARVNSKMNSAVLRGDTDMVKRLARQLHNIELALESARNATKIEPVQMAKPPSSAIRLSAAEILKRQAEEKRRRAESEKLAKQVNQYATGGIVTTTKQGGKTELQNAFLQVGYQMGHYFEEAQELGLPPQVASRPPRNSRVSDPIEAKIALTKNGNIRCSGEVLVDGCNNYYCKHRADWFNKTESVGTFGRFVSSAADQGMVSKTVHLPLCYGLVMAESVIQIRQVGPENTEGWAEYYIQHAIHQGDIAVSMKLTPHKGDTLKVAIRAIEDFYKMQPEHDLVLASNKLSCSKRDSHPLDHERNALSILHDMGIQNAKHMADVIATANSFTQLNTPGEDSLCVLCYRSRWMLP